MSARLPRGVMPTDAALQPHLAYPSAPLTPVTRNILPPKHHHIPLSNPPSPSPAGGAFSLTSLLNMEVAPAHPPHLLQGTGPVPQAAPNVTPMHAPLQPSSSSSSLSSISSIQQGPSNMHSPISSTGSPPSSIGNTNSPIVSSPQTLYPLQSGQQRQKPLLASKGSLPMLLPHPSFEAPKERKPAPLIYSAVYSGVPVYEMVCKNVPVMRRMADSYINATQILKVAGFSKPRRTKILEKEVLHLEHEKVQGGYGKYQGTWIPRDLARELAFRYRVEEDLLPIIDFEDPNGDLMTKPEYLKLVSEKNNSNASPPSLSGPVSKLPPLVNIASIPTISNIPTISSNPAPPNTTTSPTMNKPAPHHIVTPVVEQPIESAFSISSLIGTESADDVSTPPPLIKSPIQSTSPSSSPSYPTKTAKQPVTVEPSAGYSVHANQGHAESMVAPSVSYDKPLESKDSSSLMDIDIDFIRQEDDAGLADALAEDLELDEETIPRTVPIPQTSLVRRIPTREQRQQEVLMGVFMDSDPTIIISLLREPYVIKGSTPSKKAEANTRKYTDTSTSTSLSWSLGPVNTNLALDDRNRTPLHWAAAYGRVDLVRALVNAGANIFAVSSVPLEQSRAAPGVLLSTNWQDENAPISDKSNGGKAPAPAPAPVPRTFIASVAADSAGETLGDRGGEVPLMRAVTTYSCFDHQKFPEILLLLESSIRAANHDGHTIVHRIAERSGYTGQAASSLYYLKCIRDWVSSGGFQRQAKAKLIAAAEAANHSSSSTDSSVSPTTPSTPSLPLPTSPPTQFQIDEEAARMLEALLDAQDDFGETALHMAVRARCRPLVHLLIKMGASRDINAYDGTSLFDMAEEGSRMMSLLRDGRLVPSTATPESTANILMNVGRGISPFDPTSNTVSFASFAQDETTRMARAKIQAAKTEIDELNQSKRRLNRLQKQASELKKQVLKEFSVGSSSASNDTKNTDPSAPIVEVAALQQKLDASERSRKRMFEELEGIIMQRVDKDRRYKKLMALACNVSVDKVDELMESPI
ncbi:transcriptional regulator swi6 [Phlyctochytrium planicorne]|nr:transcriptional regulator swi6 [Phlyctochytrium planicorne]